MWESNLLPLLLLFTYKFITQNHYMIGESYIPPELGTKEHCTGWREHWLVQHLIDPWKNNWPLKKYINLTCLSRETDRCHFFLLIDLLTNALQPYIFALFGLTRAWKCNVIFPLSYYLGARFVAYKGYHISPPPAIYILQGWICQNVTPLIFISIQIDCA